MDLNDLRSLVTVVSFLVFLGIVVWTWSASRRQSFSAAAQLPFVEEETRENGHPVKEGT